MKLFVFRFRIVPRILLGLSALFGAGCFDQDASASDIEAKFDFVEIWDEKGRSRKDFLNEIKQMPAGICQQSLIAMGHPDGFKFPLASGKLLVTTRTAPDYRDTLPYRRQKESGLTVDSRKWASLGDAKMKNTESQLLPIFVNALGKGDDSEFERIYKLKDVEFAQYGIKLDPQKIRQAFHVYHESTRVITKQEVLSVLYLSDDETKLRSASFIVGNYLKTSEDLVEVLPLLLNKKVGVQAAITAFLNDFDGKIDWNLHVDLLQKLMNHPNPFVTILILKMLDNTGFDRTLFAQCTSGKMNSFVEILKSEVLPDEKCYLLTFLNRNSMARIECDPKEWCKRLQSR